MCYAERAGSGGSSREASRSTVGARVPYAVHINVSLRRVSRWRLISSKAGTPTTAVSFDASGFASGLTSAHTMVVARDFDLRRRCASPSAIDS